MPPVHTGDTHGQVNNSKRRLRTLAYATSSAKTGTCVGKGQEKGQQPQASKCEDTGP